jgi:hypothetical protein
VSRRIATLLSLFLAAAPAAAQVTGRVPSTGTEAFRFALHLQKVRPLSQPIDALVDAPHSMIVVVGDAGLGQLINEFELDQYLNRGGAVLIATDGPAGGPALGAARWAGDWARKFGIQITGNRVTAGRDRLYQGKKGQPFVKPKPRVADAPSPFDLFTGVEESGPRAVATNQPSEMAIQAPRGWLVKNLAGYADGARREADGRPVEPALNHFALSLQPFVLGGDSTGRLVVIANRAVYTNEMMVTRDPQAPDGFRIDNDNWEFTRRTIEWLKGPFPDHRTTCLFIEDGRIIDRFAVELPRSPGAPVPKIPPDVIANWLLNAANPIVEEAQQRDVFNRFLDRWLGFPRLLRLFLTVVTVLFILACLRRLIRGYRKHEPAATQTPAARDNLLPRGGVVRQRTAAQLDVGNLYEAARRRVRERFDVLGGRPGRSGQMPPVLTANDLPDGPLLYQSVRWLWVLGYGETPLAVPPADWDRTNVLLERVTARAARGDWSFGQEAN